jgi:hypothetical protein
MFQCRWDEGKWVSELDRDLVESPIVNTRSKSAILLSNEEKTGSSRGSRRADVTLLQSLLDIFFHGLLLRDGKGIDFTMGH